MTAGTVSRGAPRQLKIHAVRVGLRRGWTEFVQSVRSAQDQGFWVVTGLGILTYLYLTRNNVVEGTTLSMPSVAMPSVLAGYIAFGAVVGPAYSLAMEREDGTLLRCKAVPNGLVGYTVGQALYQSLSVLVSLVIVLVPSFLLFDGLMWRGAAGWLTVVGVIVLGLLATLPIGMLIGALVPSTQKVGTWGMLPVLLLLGISGIFYPVQQLWAWLQVVAQAFPMYWIGLGMRSAFLPESAAVLEVGGSWRPLQMVLVLGAWAIVGLTVTPFVLRRMARRQSGSQVEAARQAALQWVR